MRTAEITLNGKTHTLEEPKVRATARWIKLLEDEIREPTMFLLGMLDADLESEEARENLVTQGLALLGDSLDTVTDLAIEFAPALKDQIEDSYASEVVLAFMEMIKLAIPFEVNPLLELVKKSAPPDLLNRLLTLGESMQGIAPSLPSPNGENGTTMET